jgi:hypothetical protein
MRSDGLHRTTPSKHPISLSTSAHSQQDYKKYLGQAIAEQETSRNIIERSRPFTVHHELSGRGGLFRGRRQWNGEITYNSPRRPRSNMVHQTTIALDRLMCSPSVEIPQLLGVQAID